MDLAGQLDRLAPVPEHWPGLELRCLPSWGTPRDWSRPTLGPAVGLCAAGLRTRLLPWQQYVADVAGELDPVTGRLVYREIRLLVPRQSGKTTLILAEAIHRCIGWGVRQHVAYTAQTRIAAAEKWRLEHVYQLTRSPIFRDWVAPPLGEVRTAQGSERIVWPNASTWGVQSTQEDSGHGPTVDTGFIDEAFAHEDGRIEQAMRPAMVTKPNAQLWVVSTAGKLGGSPYLAAKVQDGRVRVAAGQNRRIAYFEWSAATPEDPTGARADPADVDDWWRYMPALGYTIEPEAVAADQEGMTDPDEFARAYMNLWRGRGHVISAIPPALWAQRLDETSEATGRLMWSVDMTPERDHTTVAVAAKSTTAAPATHLELVAHRPGSDWGVPFLLSRAGRWGIHDVVIDGSGPAVTFAPALQRAGFRVHVLQVPELAVACMGMHDAVRDGEVVHLGDEVLDTAVAAAGKRKLGDRWAFNRASTSSNIAPLMAVALARYGHVTWPEYDASGSFL